MPYGLLGGPSSVAMPDAKADALFDPRSVSGLALWLDPADISTVTLNGSKVSQINDKSGGGFHASQSTASLQPTYVRSGRSGKNTIRFGDVSWAPLYGSMSGILTAQTVVSVFSYSADSNFGRVFSQWVGANNDYQPLGHYIPIYKSATNVYSSYCNGNSRSSVTLSLNAWYVFSSTHNGVSISNRANMGTAVSEAVPSFYYSPTSYAWGAGAFVNNFFIGSCGDLLMWRRTLAPHELERVSRWLMAKWGV